MKTIGSSRFWYWWNHYPNQCDQEWAIHHLPVFLSLVLDLFSGKVDWNLVRTQNILGQHPTKGSLSKSFLFTKYNTWVRRAGLQLWDHSLCTVHLHYLCQSLESEQDLNYRTAWCQDCFLNKKRHTGISGREGGQ